VVYVCPQGNSTSFAYGNTKRFNFGSRLLIPRAKLSIVYMSIETMSRFGSECLI
jgi:hypothetical protein